MTTELREELKQLLSLHSVAEHHREPLLDMLTDLCLSRERAAVKSFAEECKKNINYNSENTGLYPSLENGEAAKWFREGGRQMRDACISMVDFTLKQSLKTLPTDTGKEANND